MTPASQTPSFPCPTSPSACRDNQAARQCIAKAETAAPEARRDPYLRLTHANVVMAMLPTGRYSQLKAQDKAKHHEFTSKVRTHSLYFFRVRAAV